MEFSNLAVVIPAFNEESTIQELVRELVKLAQVVVVDDCSRDCTAELASAAGATVVRLPVNSGYDQALVAGIRFLKLTACLGFATCDADGQHKVEDVRKVLSEIGQGKLVVGKRDHIPRLAEKVFARVTRGLFGIEDPLCGLKGYSMSDLPADPGPLMVGSTGTGLMLWQAKNKSNIVNVKIKVSARVDGKSRFGGSLRANFRVLVSFFGFLARVTEIKQIASVD